jgi:FkbM family methyltransferase
MYSHFRSPFLTFFVRLGLVHIAYCSYDIRKNDHTYRLLGRPRGGDHRVLREVLIDETYAVILSALSKTSLRVLDIGAHIGCFMMWLTEYKTIDEAYCFEPDPDSFNLCRFNLAQHTSVQVIMAAVAGKTRQSRILIDPAARERSTIVEDMGRSNNVRSVDTKVLSLADWMADHPGNFDLLKLDCEGAEWEILRVCPEVFSRFSSIVAEIHHDPVDHRNMTDFERAMQQLGFRVIPHSKLFFGTRIGTGV